jgi:hypothetical protein
VKYLDTVKVDTVKVVTVKVVIQKLETIKLVIQKVVTVKVVTVKVDIQKVDIQKVEIKADIPRHILMVHTNMNLTIIYHTITTAKNILTIPTNIKSMKKIMYIHLMNTKMQKQVTNTALINTLHTLIQADLIPQTETIQATCQMYKKLQQTIVKFHQTTQNLNQ